MSQSTAPGHDQVITPLQTVFGIAKKSDVRQHYAFGGIGNNFVLIPDHIYRGSPKSLWTSQWTCISQVACSFQVRFLFLSSDPRKNWMTTFPDRIGAYLHLERLVPKTETWSGIHSQLLVLRRRMVKLVSIVLALNANV